MAVNLMPEILIRHLGTAADRLATAARSADAATDIGTLRALETELVDSYERAMRIAPESMHGVSADAAEQLSSAIRGVRMPDSTLRSDSLEGLSALADAARRVAPEALRAMPTVRPVRVVVGGGGPGGLATANLLRKMGADVTVAHPGATDWRTGILIERRSWDILRETGGEQLLRDAPVDAAGTSIMVPLSLVDSELSAHAKRIGVDIRDTHRVRSAETVDGAAIVGIQDDTTGGVQAVQADWYVDATGGASPVAHQDAFKRRMFEGTFGALPQKRLFMHQSAPSLEHAPLGWTGPKGAFVVNDKLAGKLMVYRPVPEFVRGQTLSAQEGGRLLESVGVDPATAIGSPSAVMARQRLAPGAAQGRLLMVGDSVGSVMPVTQAGVLLALLDARRAAETIGMSRGAVTAAVGDALRSLDELTRGGSAATDDAVRTLGADASATADAAISTIVSKYDAETVGAHRTFLS